MGYLQCGATLIKGAWNNAIFYILSVRMWDTGDVHNLEVRGGVSTVYHKKENTDVFTCLQSSGNA